MGDEKPPLIGLSRNEPNLRLVLHSEAIATSSESIRRLERNRLEFAPEFQLAS